jgi:putative ABC transport system substrate-binding protein
MQFDQLKRREFIMLLGGAAAAPSLLWPRAARTQDAGRLRRIGVLSSIGESDLEAQSMAAAFNRALQEAGWVEGRNVRIDHRWAAGSVGRIETFARQLVALQPDVLVAHTTPSVNALRKETATTPIVFVQVSDPIGAGFIANLARPGGNITGFSNFEASIGGKWIEMLKEIAPAIGRGALIFNPETAPYVARYYQGPFEAAARAHGVQPSAYPVRNESEIVSAVTALDGEPPGSLIVMPDTFNIVYRERIIELAARHKLPAIYPYTFAAREGGLISYGVDPVDLFRRAADYVDRIKKGLSEVGIIEGRDVTIEDRAADGHYDGLPALAAELVQRRPVVIAANFLPAALAAKAAAQTIPIVFLSGSDPIGSGLVSSISRPTGNVTGIAPMFTLLGTKNLELLHELVPKVSVIGGLVNLTNPNAEHQVKDLQAAAHVFGQELVIFAGSNEQEIDSSFAAIAQRGIGALVVTADGLLISRQDQIVALAARYAVPAMYH